MWAPVRELIAGVREIVSRPLAFSSASIHVSAVSVQWLRTYQDACDKHSTVETNIVPVRFGSLMRSQESPVRIRFDRVMARSVRRAVYEPCRCEAIAWRMTIRESNWA